VNRSAYALENVSARFNTSGYDGVKKNITKKIFYLSIDKSGKYYLGAHVLASITSVNKNDSFNLQEIKVSVNSQYVENLDIKVPEWDFVVLNKNIPIQLNAGKNEITFESLAPFYPEVDAISITEKIGDFYSFVESEKHKIFNNGNSNGITTRSAFDTSSSWTTSPFVADAPLAIYPNKAAVPIAYTYYKN
jgi:hypothetical protein